MSDAGIVWEEPPAAHTKWATIAEALRSRPNEWAKVASDVWPATATSIKTGRAAGFTVGEYETRSVGIPGSQKANIYARYIGPKS